MFQTNKFILSSVRLLLDVIHTPKDTFYSKMRSSFHEMKYIQFRDKSNPWTLRLLSNRKLINGISNVRNASAWRLLVHSLTLCFIAWPKNNIFDRNFDFKIRRDEQKISYERRVYESENENSLSKAISQKTDEKNKSCNKGLNKMKIFEFV